MFSDKIMTLCKFCLALSIGALLGIMEGVRLLGLLREKENAYLGSFSWIQRTLKVKSGGHLELVARNRAPLSRYQIKVHKGPIYKT